MSFAESISHFYVNKPRHKQTLMTQPSYDHAWGIGMEFSRDDDKSLAILHVSEAMRDRNTEISICTQV